MNDQSYRLNQVNEVQDEKDFNFLFLLFDDDALRCLYLGW